MTVSLLLLASLVSALPYDSSPKVGDPFQTFVETKNKADREDGSCIADLNDKGATSIKHLQKAIDEAACTIVEDITYSDYDVQDTDIFDFIIIGAGSAGCVLANRLTENPDWNVLLLEAGGDPTITTEIPYLWPATVDTEIDWGYRTEPEPTNCLGMVNKRCGWPRGKLLGGSSAINALLYLRGHPLDFDGWEELGNLGWGYKNLLHYFKKSESMISKEVIGNENVWDYHGKDGYLKIDSYKDDHIVLGKILSEGFKELGLETFTDVNADKHEGFFALQGTMENGRRCSTAKAFLKKFQSRPNLKISKHSLVTKILIDENKTAYGVEFTKNGWTSTVKAAKEVILSGGTINSPQLLMLSGIGPRAHLERLGINVVKDLKVGYNLQDHIKMMGFPVSFNTKFPNIDEVKGVFEFLIEGTGAYAGTPSSVGGVFMRTSKATYPNIQFYFYVIPANSPKRCKSMLENIAVDSHIINSMLEMNAKKSILLVIPCLLRPVSTGRVMLKTTNPSDHPLIYPGYFSQEEDLEITLEAVRFAEKFTETDTMRKLGAKVERLGIPGCDSLEFRSDSYWRCVIQHMSVTVYHPIGTCKMGPPGDPDAVVNPRLCVKGIKNLQVIDASIIPSEVSANIHAAVIAAAEMASDFIKEFWK